MKRRTVLDAIKRDETSLREAVNRLRAGPQNPWNQEALVRAEHSLEMIARIRRFEMAPHTITGGAQ